MSKYDGERKSLGITSGSSKPSKYDAEREQIQKDAQGVTTDMFKQKFGFNPLTVDPLADFQPMQGPPKPAEELPFLARAQKTIYDNTLGPVTNLLQRGAASAVDSLSLGQSKKFMERNQESAPSFMQPMVQDSIRPASGFAEKVADTAGMIYGSVPSILGAYGTGGKVAASALAKYAPNASRLAQTAVRGAGAGLAYGTAREGLDEVVNPEDKNFGQRLAGVGLDAALFAGGDAAFGLAGIGLKKLAGTKLGDAVSNFLSRNKSTEPTTQPTLQLTSGRPRGNANTAQTPDVMYGEGNIYKPEPLGLPEPSLLPPTRARVETRPNIYTKKLEALFEQGNQTKFTPGREIEELESMWSQMAGPDDPNLNQLIELAYPTTKPKVDMGSLGRAKELQRATEVAGAPTKAMSIGERYAQGGVKADAAMPVERVGFRQPEVTITPPKNNFAPTGKKGSKYAAEREQILKEEVPDVVEHAEPRIRDKVTNYLDEAAQAARERLKAKRNTLSSNPVDQYADYAIIGASHIANGVKKFADFSERMVADFGESVRPHLKEIFNRSKGVHKEAELRTEKDMQGLKDIDPTMLKDFSGLKYNSSDVYRNFKDVFREKFPQMKKAILDPLDDAKMQNVKMQEEWLNKMYTEVVEKLGIEKGSKLSALVQRFGEKKLDLTELKRLAPKDWENVVKADEFFRKAYDDLIDVVNETRKSIYPNNPDKIVPKRSDYYRHFQEFSSLTGLKNIFDTPAGIDPNLVGLSEFTLPKSKFAGFMQKRGLGPYKNDAVGGFLNYIPSASYATHIDPQIDVFKNLAKNLASETEQTKNINGFIEFLQKYSQDLAGKTNSLDRAFQEYIPGGRKTMGVINWVNNRVKSNTILGNAGSALAQIANIPVGIAFAKQYAVKGAGKTLISAIKGNPLHEESQFLKERFVSKEYRKFDTRWLDPQNPLKLKNAAVWMLEQADRMGTEFIWNSSYDKAIKEGLENPVKYADDNARRLIAGRGVGEVPLMQKSKLFQVVAPFTLEVANLWRIQKDFIKEKDFGALALLLVGNYAFNKVAEQVRGSGVTFDPIQAIVEASADDLSPLQRAGRVAGEVVSNVPLGGALASMYPEYGLGSMPTRKKLFGDNDPTRFGTGLLAAKGVMDPYKIIPGFGGNQLKKSIAGVKAVAKGAEVKDGELKYNINMSPLKAAQSILFSPNATSEAQKYFKMERRPLSEKQTSQLQSLPKDEQNKAYDYLMMQRKIESLKRQAKEVSENEKTSMDKKQKQMESLIKKYQDLTNSQ